MTESESHDHDDATCMDESSDDGEPERLTPEECHETVDPDTRDDVLVEYLYRCQVCGRRGPEKGGLATLHVHHIERDPDGMDEHDMENLTLLCRSCHSWFHQQTTPEDAPVELTEQDLSVLLPQDIEILRVLAVDGPARTGDIAGGLTVDLSVSAVRERLWVLMGLDNRVAGRDRQIVDKDVDTLEWGLTEQIETSARGHIPDDQQLLLQRMEDEQVRQALERGCDRSDVTEVFGISRRTTFNKIKRAYAYDFPLEAFRRSGAAVQATQSVESEGSGDDESDGDEQRRLGDVADEESDLGRTETWGTTNGASEGSVADVPGRGNGASADEEVRVQLRRAIEALEEVDAALDGLN